MAIQFVIWLNTIANALASVLFAPIAIVPGWISATVIAAATGVLMLLAFKYTSNQAAIKRVRNDIKANLLALSLFKDSIPVSLRSQGRILRGAGRLLWLALLPMFVMLIPMCLLLGQLAAWYQARPLQVDEPFVVTVQLNDTVVDRINEVQLRPSPTIETMVGPVRIPSKNMVCWSIQAVEPGYHRLVVTAGSETYEKELAIGDGFMRVSPQRPGWNWADALLYPRETPLAKEATIQAIEVDYPKRQSWTAGSDTWLMYWFAASMVAAFIARPLLKVNI